MKKIMVLVVLVSLLVACSSDKFETSEAVKEFYTASNNKDYETAEKYIAQEVFDYAASKGYDIRDAVDTFTQNGNMKEVEVISEEIHGEMAVVVAKVTFNNEMTMTKVLPMFLENGTWKIGLER